ncbi:MAG: hypothetical protein WA771_14455 [Chthoniobacterales bacterium]
MSRESTVEKIYVGTYPRTMDAKNRVSIPAEWDFTESDTIFLLPSSTKDYINLMSAAEFSRKEDEVMQTVVRKQQRAVIRGLFGSAHQLKPDKQGRIVIPEKFCKAVGLTNSISFVGVKDSIEIWDSSKATEAVEAEAGYTEDTLEALADAGL